MSEPTDLKTSENDTQEVTGNQTFIPQALPTEEKRESDEAPSVTDLTNHDATTVSRIAKFYRHHRNAREIKGKVLSAKSRDEISSRLQDKHSIIMSKWDELITEVLEIVRQQDRSAISTSLTRNMKTRAELMKNVGAQIGKGTTESLLWLILDTEHWLELCDDKHRYGSNLKVYHDHWLQESTDQNFFYWLDLGDGKNVDIPTRSRKILEEQQVTYLKLHERAECEADIEDGMLIYKKSGKPVHTNPRIKKRDQSEARPGGGNKEKWIYVTDCNENLYVHKKTKGKFHHSSFLAGGAICAAGQIKVNQGRLLEINPKSGHYKPGQKHFKALISRLKEKGVDFTDVEVVSPNDIYEERLIKKYKSKRLAHLDMHISMFKKDVEKVVAKVTDKIERDANRAARGIETFLHIRTAYNSGVHTSSDDIRTTSNSGAHSAASSDEEDIGEIIRTTSNSGVHTSSNDIRTTSNSGAHTAASSDEEDIGEINDSNKN